MQKRFKVGVMKSRYYKLVRYYRDNLYEGNDAERHHVMPKSMGGSNKHTNIVVVPARVHFVLHWLLTRIAVSEEHRAAMHYAFWRMLHPRTRCNVREYRISSRVYAKVRKYHRKLMRANNPMHRPEVLAKVTGRKRPDQSAVLRKTNEARWAARVFWNWNVQCHSCLAKHVVILPEGKEPKQNWCCCKACYNRYYVKPATPELTRRRVEAAAYARSCKTTTTKGRANPTAAANGKAGAEKNRQHALGRKRAYRDDGSWYWVKPDDVFAQAA